MRCRFPRYLTQPFQILWFEPDDLAICTVFFLVWQQFKGWFLFAAIFVGTYAYSHLKRQYPRGFLRHTLYFIGFAPMKGYPTFFEKVFQE